MCYKETHKIRLTNCKYIIKMFYNSLFNNGFKKKKFRKRLLNRKQNPKKMLNKIIGYMVN